MWVARLRLPCSVLRRFNMTIGKVTLDRLSVVAVLAFATYLTAALVA